MGDGFTADPDQLRSYAQRVDNMADAIGEGRDAADHIMTTNSVDVSGDPMRGARDWVLSKAGLHDNGKLDLAYGVICQPAGMLMEDIQQAITDSISHVMDMMAALSAGLRQSATQYTQDDVRGRGLISDAGKGTEEALIPMPSDDTSVTGPRGNAGSLPRMPRIPEPNRDTSVVAPMTGPAAPLPHLSPIPRVRRDG